MSVAELIAELQKLDPSLVVETVSDSGRRSGASWVEVNKVSAWGESYEAATIHA